MEGKSIPSEKDINYYIEKLPDNDEDAFEFNKILPGIAENLAKSEPPFVYAVCGGWGSGKSSFLKLLIKHINKYDKDTKIIYFNALKSSINSDILFSFVYELYSQIASLKLIDLNKENLKKFKSSLKTFAKETMISLKKTLLKPIIETYQKSAGRLDKNMIESKLSDERTRRDFELVCEIIDTDNIYVFIDELDRCNPKDVVRILESIKMYFSVQDDLHAAIQNHNYPKKEKNKLRIPFKYLMTIDEKFVAKAFQGFYNLNLDEAYKYYSKFINFKYHLPKKNWKLFITNILNLYDVDKKHFPNESDNDFVNIITNIGIENPRYVRRVLVTLIIWQRRLNKEFELFELIQNEVNQPYEIVFVIRAINCYLLLFAILKETFPDFIEKTIKHPFFENVPAIKFDNLDSIKSDPDKNELHLLIYMRDGKSEIKSIFYDFNNIDEKIFNRFLESIRLGVQIINKNIIDSKKGTDPSNYFGSHFGNRDILYAVVKTLKKIFSY